MVIGLDGATFDIISPWAEEGKLPTLKKLMGEGIHGNLRSTIPCATIPAWPSFATGCNPGKHGFYDFFKEKDNSYEMTVESLPSRAIKQPTLWDILSRNDKSVALINVPGTYPPAKVNGHMITGLFTPSNAKYTYPPGFGAELERSIGKYDVFFSALSAKNPRVLMRDLEQTLEQRVKAALYLWKEKQPQFLMVVDNGTDRAEHELWRFLDASNPLYDARDVQTHGNPLLTYFQKVDEMVGEMVSHLDENTTLIIMSDHGQASLRKFVNLNLFLLDEGFMSIKNEAKSRLRYLLFDHGYSPRSLYVALRKLGLERFATDRVSQRTRLSLLNGLFFSTSDIDWPRTKAFASGVTGAICINLKDRQPQGTISQGTEYESLRDEIIDRLAQLKDPETGVTVVEAVHRREEIYHGPCLHKAPDIIATAGDGYEFFGMHGFSFCKVIEKTFGNSGSHSPDGIFMAVGRDIKRGARITTANILDVAPTILHIMGLPVPETMDGTVLKEIFEPNGALAG